MYTTADQSLLSICDAAKRLGVSTKTLRRWEAAGKIIPSRTFGNQRRYTVEQIEAMQHPTVQRLPARPFVTTAGSVSSSHFSVIPTKAGIGIGFFGKRQILAFARMTSIAIGILLVAIGVFTELVKPNEKTKNIFYNENKL